MGRKQQQSRRDKSEAGVRLATTELLAIGALLDTAASGTEERFPRAILQKNVDRARAIRLELMGVVGILRAAGRDPRKSA